MCRSSCDEQRTIERFRARYATAAGRAERAVELAAIGANVGANGYTTVKQAAELGSALRLRPGVRLLDLGCGRGYPGVFLARTTGCTVVGSDLPLASLRLARERARRDGIGRRAAQLTASAVHPPFRPASFDAIVHTDVLCCLRPKLAVLRACYRLLRPGGRMAFTTIYAAPGVSASDYRRAREARGAGFAERRPIANLLAAAGFTAIHERDVSAAFARTTRAYLDAAAPVERQLREAWGEERLATWLRDRRATVHLIEEGVVRRGLFTARRGAGE